MTEHVDGPAELPADFAAFYAETVTYVLGIARRTAAGDHDLAWDATQEAYVRMLKRWPARRWLSVRDNRSYLTAIAVNQVKDSFRRRRGVELRDEHDGVFEVGDFDAVLTEMGLLAAVRDFLDRQPVRRRAVGVLYFIEGLRTAEVGDALGMDESTVRTHVQRLRALLKPFVDRIIEEERGGEWA